MENLTSMQNTGIEQQISYLKEVNDKLLRKYIIAQTKDYFGDQFVLFATGILFVVLGIFANQQFGLKWPVIVAICSTFFLGGLYYLIISLPLSKGNLTITNIQNLQPTLLKYKKCDIIGTAILLPVITGLFIWLAFELYDLFTERIWIFEIDNRPGVYASVITIIFTLLLIFSGIYSTYNSSKHIDSLVVDIEECKFE